MFLAGIHVDVQVDLINRAITNLYMVLAFLSSVNLYGENMFIRSKFNRFFILLNITINPRIP